jgi:hypothetical protein
MGDKYYIVMDTYVDEVVDGKIVARVKDPFRDRLNVFRRPQAVSGNVVIERERCVTVGPNKAGIYCLREVDGNQAEKMKAMEVYMAAHPSIVGPFDSTEKAMIEREKRRPKTRVETLEAEVSDLRARLEKNK